MKIKVSETTRLQLDWLVAKCEAKRIKTSYVSTPKGKLFINSPMNPKGRLRAYSPSTNPAQGQPILEREIDQLDRTNDYPNWEANRFATDDYEDCVGYGPTMLIAGLRCYVASKLGDEVEVPEELL